MVASSDPAVPADVARHYDQLDRFYREVWGEHVHHGYWRTGRETPEEAARALVDLVIDRARLRPGMSVLDVGCGYGATSRILASEKEVLVTGLTLSPAQQRHAESTTALACNPVFLVEDWLRNQRASASHDVVIGIECTEHMADKAHAYAEMARVLKPGGRMVVVAWAAADHRTPWQDRHLMEPICREAKFTALATAPEHQAWIAAAGLTLEETLDLSPSVSRTWPVLAGRFMVQVLRRPSLLRFLIDHGSGNSVFGLTMVRIWLAYRLGALRFIIFTAAKPA